MSISGSDWQAVTPKQAPASTSDTSATLAVLRIPTDLTWFIRQFLIVPRLISPPPKQAVLAIKAKGEQRNAAALMHFCGTSPQYGISRLNRNSLPKEKGRFRGSGRVDWINLLRRTRMSV